MHFASLCALFFLHKLCVTSILRVYLRALVSPGHSALTISRWLSGDDYEGDIRKGGVLPQGKIRSSAPVLCSLDDGQDLGSSWTATPGHLPQGQSSLFCRVCVVHAKMC